MTEETNLKKSFYSQFKKPIGITLVIVGAILHLIPLFPASGIVVLGLELAGVRILLQDKIKNWLKHKPVKKDI